jgi:hypothetical protein
MNLDVPSIANTMIQGVRQAIGKRWSAIRAIAEPELRLLAQKLEDVQQLYASGEIDANRALQLVEMQRNTAMGVLRTVQGLGVLTAREALDAAAHAAGSVVNRLVGFELIRTKGEVMSTRDQEIPKETTTSQESAKDSSTGRTKENPTVSPAKPASRPVKAQFKAGKDI